MTTTYMNWFSPIINEIFGGWEVYVIVALLLLAIIAARYRLNNQVFMALIASFMLMFSYFFPILKAITLLIVGLYIAWMIQKVVSR